MPCTDILAPLSVDIQNANTSKLVTKPEWTGIRQQAVHLATLVLPPGMAPSFVQSIAMGRYQCL